MKTLSLELTAVLAAMSLQVACEFGEPCLGNCNGSVSSGMASTGPGTSGGETEGPGLCCVGSDLEWGYVGGDVLGRHPPSSRITACDEFSGPFPAESQQVCANQLPACGAEAEVDPEIVREAIADDDVQAALAQAPVLFGLDLRPVDGPIFQILIDGQQILVGEACGDEPECAPTPAGVQALVEALRATSAQQATAEMCPYDPCTLPAEPGFCDAAFSRYFFNATLGRCEEFTYGGCDGNENNFETHTECFAACGGDPIPVSTVVEASSCYGLGIQESMAGDQTTFTQSDTVIGKELFWGCGCPTAPEFVLAYEPTSPLTLRLCHDEGADPCEAGCLDDVYFDLGPALLAAGASDFVFVDP